MKKTTWHRVRTPQRWRPKHGDELIGTYLCTELRDGQFGEYRAHHVKVRDKVHFVSGTVADDLFALLEPNTRVKLVFTGTKLCKDGLREYKIYELYTEQEIELKIADFA